MQVEIIRLKNGEGMPFPSYATNGSAGMDLCAACEEDIKIYPGDRVLIPTGIAISLPYGVEAQIRPRSGLALKHGVTVLNSPGTIDSDYRGEIKVILVNIGDIPFTVCKGNKIAQMVICEFKKIEWEKVLQFDVQTDRGEGGFGSTGF